MALPQLLLVDDSEAILAYERAALGDAYALTLARDGVDALDKLRALIPAAIVLDLSMPRMDGEELLSRLRDDDELRDVPVLLVSTESERARALVAGGTVAGFLPKPIEARALRAAVERILDEARWRRSRAGLAVLRLDVGPLRLAVPLASVRAVVSQPLCSVVAGGPSYLRELFELEGQPVLVLDLARRLGVAPAARYVDRSLVVVHVHAAALAAAAGAAGNGPAGDGDERIGTTMTGPLRIALAVDDVRDPEVIAADHVVPPGRVGGATQAPLDGLLVALVRSQHHQGAAAAGARAGGAGAGDAGGAFLPVVKPEALLSPALARELAETLATYGGTGAPGAEGRA